MKTAKAPDIVNNEFFGGFSDLLDAVNPLHHIPGVATAYQAATGDTIGAGARILGGALFGGPLGVIGSIANAIFAQETGRDIGTALLAALTGDDKEPEALTASAGQTTPVQS